MGSNENFSSFITGLQAGDSVAEAQVYQRYMSRLVAIARKQMADRFNAKLDPEDVIQSVMKSFYLRHANGEFHFDGWDSLWALLARITVRKCQRQAAKMDAAKRDAKREVAVNALTGWQLVSQSPTPEQAMIASDLITALFQQLTERQQEIVSLRLQQYTIEEISEKSNLTERTVYRTLEMAREQLQKLGSVSSE